MIYSGHTIEKIYYSGYTVTAAYSCGGYQVFSADTGTSACTKLTYVWCGSDTSEHTVSGTGYVLTSGDTNNQRTEHPDASTKYMKKAIVGDCITIIGANAFRNETCMTGVTFPNTLERIHPDAFAYTYCLKHITFPSSLKFIGDYAFYVSALESVNIPDNVYNIGKDAFWQNSGLTDVHIGSGITYIGNDAFNGCSALTSVTITATNPPELHNAAVFNNTNNCPIYVPCDSVNAYKTAQNWSTYASRIQAYLNYRTISTAFTCVGYDKYYLDEYQVSYDCKNTWVTTATTIGELYEADSAECHNGKFKATYLGGSTYSADCDGNATITTATTKPFGYQYTAMTDAIIGNCITSIGQEAFSGGSSLSSVTIPNSLTTIGFYAFEDCNKITGITLPETVTSIGIGAFRNCSGMTSINVPSGITSINGNTFDGCSGLTSIDIPSGVTTIGNYAFNNCKSLLSITVRPTTPPTLGSYVFAGTNENFIIYVPSTSINSYKNASGWSTYASRIQAIQT